MIKKKLYDKILFTVLYTVAKSIYSGYLYKAILLIQSVKLKRLYWTIAKCFHLLVMHCFDLAWLKYMDVLFHKKNPNSLWKFAQTTI